MVSNPFGSPLTVQIDSDVSGLHSGLDNAISKLSSLEGAVGAAGGALAALSAGGIAKSISAAGDLNASLTESQAIMGDLSSGEMKQMENAAREVGRTTTFSADEAGQAFYYLASAGMDAEQSVAAIGDVSKFAQAGMFDLETATDLSTDALTSLGMAAEDPQENLENLNRVQDTFVRANELANASVEQYAEAMTNKLGPAMRSAGMEVEEGTAALAVFADAGLKGRRAGTILTRTIEGLQDNARDNAEAFQELGIQVYDAEGNMRPLQSIVQDLEGAMEGMSTEQRAATMEQLGFNQRARQGIEILMGNSDALGEYQGELENAGGATERVAEKQLQSFHAQLDLLKSQFQDIAIEIGTVFLPVLERLVSAFSVVVEWFGELNSRTDGMVGAITLLTGVFSGLAMMGWSVVSMLGGLGPTLALVKGIAVGLALPFIKIIAVIGTLITIGAALHQAWASNFAGIREQTMRVVGAIRGQFLRVMEVAQAVIGPILTDILGAFTGFGDGAESSLSRVISAVADILVAGIQWAGDAIVQTLLWLRGWWQQHGETVVGIISTTLDAIATVIDIGLAVIKDIIFIATAIWRGNWELAWIGIFNIVGDILGRIAGFLERWFPGIGDRMAMFLIEWRQKWIEWGQRLREIVGGALGFLRNTIIGPFLAWFGQIWNQYFASTIQESGGIWNLFKETVSGAVSFIWNDLLQPFLAWFGQMWRQNFSGVLQAGIGLWQRIAQSVGSAISFIWNELLAPFLSWFVQMWKQNFVFVIQTALGVWDRLSSTVSRVISFIWHELLQPFITWYISTWATHFTTVLNEAAKTWDVLSSAVNRVVSFIWYELLQPFIAWFGPMWRKHFQQVVDEASITWQRARDEIGTAVAFIQNEAIGPFIAWFGPRWTKLWAQVRSVLSSFLNWAQPKVQTVLSWIQNRWDVWGDAILGTAKTLFESLRLTIGQLMDTISTIIIVALRIIRGDWSGAWDEIRGYFSRTADRIVSLAETWVDTIVDLVSTLGEEVISLFQWLYRKLVGGSIVPNMLSDILDAFRVFEGDALKWLRGLMSDLLTRAKNGLSDIHSAFTRGLNEVKKVLARKGRELLSRMKTVVSNLHSAIADKISHFKTAGKRLMQSFASGIKSATKKAKRAAKNGVEEVEKYFPDSPAETGPLSDLDEYGPALVDEFASGIEDSTSRMTDATDTLAGETRSGLPDTVETNIQGDRLDNLEAIRSGEISVEGLRSEAGGGRSISSAQMLAQEMTNDLKRAGVDQTVTAADLIEEAGGTADTSDRRSPLEEHADAINEVMMRDREEVLQSEHMMQALEDFATLANESPAAMTDEELFEWAQQAGDWRMGGGTPDLNVGVELEGMPDPNDWPRPGEGAGELSTAIDGMPDPNDWPRPGTADSGLAQAGGDGPTLDDIVEKHGELDWNAFEEALQHFDDQDVDELAQAIAEVEGDPGASNRSLSESEARELITQAKEHGKISQALYDYIGAGRTHDVLESALAGPADTLSSSASRTSSSLDTMSSRATDLSRSAGSASRSTSSLSSSAGSASSALSSTSGSAGQLQQQINDLKSSVGSTSRSTSSLSRSTSSAASNTSSLSSSAGSASSTLGSTTDEVKQLQQEINQLKNSVGSTSRSTSNASSNTSKLSSSVNDASNSTTQFTNTLQQGAEKLAGATDSLSQSVSDTGPTLDDIVEKHGELDWNAFEEALQHFDDQDVDELAQAIGDIEGDPGASNRSLSKSEARELITQARDEGQVSQALYDHIDHRTHGILESALAGPADNLSSATNSLSNATDTLSTDIQRTPTDAGSAGAPNLGQHIDSLAKSNRKAIGRVEEKLGNIHSAITNADDGTVELDGKKVGDITTDIQKKSSRRWEVTR